MAGACDNNMSAYDHWFCQRARGHLGRHRYNNYTAGRIPQVWRLRRLLGVYKTNQRLRRLNDVKPGETTIKTYSYRKVLFPVRFDPIDERRKVAI